MNIMKNIGFILFVITMCCVTMVEVFGQNYNQNVNQNVNQNTVIINNQPVIEKKEYIIKYRPVYINKPTPKRVARKLPAPVCLLNYLWVYPEDLGNYDTEPGDIIRRINQQGLYGRNDWRVPSPEELRLMENYADKCGLGDGIYLAASHKNGILRLVSTGKSIQEQNRDDYLAEQRRREYEQKQYEAEQRRRQEAAAAAAKVYQQSVAAQSALISSGNAILNGNLIWATKNKGANNAYEKGIAYLDILCTDNWRLPTEREFKNLLSQSIKRVSYYEHPCGLIIPFGVYAIQRNDGSDGYIMLPDKMVSSGSSPTFVRLVQSKIN